MNILKRNKTLFLAIFIYIAIAIMMPDKIGKVFENSLYYFKELFEVIPLILLLTAMIDAWIPQELIGDKIGSGAGIKGYALSLLIGSVSAGPIYAAFPVTKMLYKKGAGLSNVTIILSAWAVIKLPMLINETKFLGFNYMITRWIITIFAIMIIGTIVGKLVKREDVDKNIKLDKQKELIEVDKAYCIGCGICAKLEPKHFEIINKKAIAKKIDEANMDDIKNIAKKCPVKAIKVI